MKSLVAGFLLLLSAAAQWLQYTPVDSSSHLPVIRWLAEEVNEL